MKVFSKCLIFIKDIIGKTGSYRSVSTGEAEKDYWSRIRGIQEKHKDNRSYKGRYYFVLGWLCFILPVYVLFCSALSREVYKKTPAMYAMLLL